MATVAPPLAFLLALLGLAGAAFPEEPGPLSSVPSEVVRRYPVFLGRAHRSSLRQEPLHIQSILKVNRTLYIGSRDDLFRLELDNVVGDEMFYSKKRSWESNRNDIRICRMKGKQESREPGERRGLFPSVTSDLRPLLPVATPPPPPPSPTWGAGARWRGAVGGVFDILTTLTTLPPPSRSLNVTDAGFPSAPSAPGGPGLGSTGP
ncbi:semaphorin-6B-like [Conger conger]|uniref:semaphorin-6B-like n=1 Tax=Conger conger TaxID=82655 RepID=UPI002A5AFEAB|nr:semaphorin-6B-like [Conger conger]